MVYTNISALVPEGEHFDESAIGEGVWLSVQHIKGIESALASVNAVNAQLATSAETIQTMDGNITILHNTIESLETALAARDADLQEARQENAAQQARIEALEAEVKALGQKSSGTGTTLATITDDEPGASNNGKPSWFKDDGSASLAEKYTYKK